MTTPKNVMKMIKDNDVKYVDFRFTDPRGKWQHVTSDVTTVDEDTFADGIMFDGSSIAGWKAIHESDMQLMPDPESACLDPFFAETTLVLVCDTLEPLTGEPYNRDPRSIAKKAAGLVKSMGVGDTIFFGPEAEFFIFDDVRYSATPYNTGYRVDSVEFPTNSNTEYEGGNLGHHIGFKKGYFPVPPLDTAQDMRSEMLAAMARMGSRSRSITTRSARRSTSSACSSRRWCGWRTRCRSTNTASSRSRRSTARRRRSCRSPSTATTAPACTATNRSGKATSRCSPATNMPTSRRHCLQYIAGILKHARAINAFTNPTTNSYKRLVPGFEAPVLLAYSVRNRSASCRIPLASSPKGKRVEVRYPDPLCNPYLGFAAMLMAGLDGIKNKLNPGEPTDKDLYDLPPKELKKIPTVCGSLREALDESRQGP